MNELSPHRHASRIDRIVVGLGNPGNEYSGTRHNLGFMALDAFLESIGVPKNFQAAKKSRAQMVEVDGKHILLIKPSTYMNLSGLALAPVLAASGLNISDVLVVHDEMDIPEGLAKMRVGGGASGHKGVAHIIETCGEEFARIKIGIGAPTDDFDGADWVLQKLTPEDKQIFDGILPVVAEGIKKWIIEGSEKAMTLFNTKIRKPGDEPADGSEDKISADE